MKIKEMNTIKGETGYKSYDLHSKQSNPKNEDVLLKPPKKTIGIAYGKYKMPPDELFFDDEISEMFCVNN